MNNFKFLILFVLFIGCNKGDLNNKIISDKNEYWKYSNNCFKPVSLYFKFNADGTCNKYNRDIFDGFELFNNDDDVISQKRTWSIKDDSIFVWNNENYNILQINKDTIILTYNHNKIKNKKCTIIFEKVIDQ